MFCPGQVAGAFGQPTSRAIVENGSPAGDVTDHVPHASRLASVFCIPKTGNLALDEAASLPGPGALGVETRVQIF